jgi:hypothetical protein
LIKVGIAAAVKADVVVPPAPTQTLEDSNRPTELRTREGAKQQCMLEAQRHGKAASLWCAGL